MIAVVVVDPGHELAPDQREGVVYRRCCPDIFRKLNDLEARIAITPDYLGGPIGRGIVDDDDLNGKAPPKTTNGVQAVPDIVLAIVDIEDDGDERMAHVLGLLLAPGTHPGAQPIAVLFIGSTLLEARQL